MSLIVEGFSGNDDGLSEYGRLRGRGHWSFWSNFRSNWHRFTQAPKKRTHWPAKPKQVHIQPPRMRHIRPIWHVGRPSILPDIAQVSSLPVQHKAKPVQHKAKPVQHITGRPLPVQHRVKPGQHITGRSRILPNIVMDRSGHPHIVQGRSEQHITGRPLPGQHRVKPGQHITGRPGILPNIVQGRPVQGRPVQGRPAHPMSALLKPTIIQGKPVQHRVKPGQLPQLRTEPTKVSVSASKYPVSALGKCRKGYYKACSCQKMNSATMRVAKIARQNEYVL